MWEVRSADGSRSYSVRAGKRGKIMKLINRRGDVLRVDGPTADEVYRAMRRYHEKQRRDLSERAKDFSATGFGD